MWRPLYLHLALLSLTASVEPTRLLRQRRNDLKSSDIVASGVSPLDADGPNNQQHDPPPSQEPKQKSLIEMQFTQHDPHAHRNKLQMIQNGELSLVAIRYSPNSFSAHANGSSSGGADADDDYFTNGVGDGESYSEVYGEFCAFDPSVNKEDPAKLPTTQSIVSTFDHCAEHRYLIPLHKAMQAIRFHDDIASSFSSNNKMRQLPVSGLLFHEGYSGAGLISNVLAGAFDSTRVISEHAALRDALSACDTIRNRHKTTDCSAGMQLRLVRDIVTLLSRIPSDLENDSIQHLYLKLSSASSAYLPELRSLYPQASWTFTYRNADESLAKATSQKERRRTCSKARRNPTQALIAKSTEHNVNLEQLSHHEVCALHLSSLVDVAGKEHDESGTGMLISYNEDILSSNHHENVAFINVILPYLGLQDDIHANPQGIQDRISQILSVRSNYSSRSRRQDDKGWAGIWDGEHVEISEQVGAASKVFMSDSMDSITRFVNMEMLTAKLDTRRR